MLVLEEKWINCVWFKLLHSPGKYVILRNVIETSLGEFIESHEIFIIWNHAFCPTFGINLDIFWDKSSFGINFVGEVIPLLSVSEDKKVTFV